MTFVRPPSWVHTDVLWTRLHARRAAIPGRPVPVRLGPTHPGAHLQRQEYLLDGALFFVSGEPHLPRYGPERSRVVVHVPSPRQGRARIGTTGNPSSLRRPSRPAISLARKSADTRATASPARPSSRWISMRRSLPGGMRVVSHVSMRPAATRGWRRSERLDSPKSPAPLCAVERRRAVSETAPAPPEETTP